MLDDQLSSDNVIWLSILFLQPGCSRSAEQSTILAPAIPTLPSIVQNLTEFTALLRSPGEGTALPIGRAQQFVDNLPTVAFASDRYGRVTFFNKQW